MKLLRFGCSLLAMMFRHQDAGKHRAYSITQAMQIHSSI
jgi:hypothetical protein